MNELKSDKLQQFLISENLATFYPTMSFDSQVAYLTKPDDNGQLSIEDLRLDITKDIIFVATEKKSENTYIYELPIESLENIHTHKTSTAFTLNLFNYTLPEYYPQYCISIRESQKYIFVEVQLLFMTSVDYYHSTGKNYKLSFKVVIPSIPAMSTHVASNSKVIVKITPDSYFYEHVNYTKYGEKGIIFEFIPTIKYNEHNEGVYNDKDY